ncbi:MAG: HAD-superfamily hydrolase, subfamily variant 3 [Phycisphaerales bacterium]|nr:HAD-superfamily hydrolase, subfamily variant 3 [Phycisphaerales bacterium]
MIVVPEHIKGLVFDCDGTIAHTMPLHYQAWVQALGEHGVDFPEALFYEFGGMPTEVIIATLNERHGYSMPVEETAHRKEDLFEQFIPQVTPIEPVVQLIRDNIGKLPMAVATGGWRRIATKTLTAMGVIQHLQAIVCAEDVKHGKPAPDIFLEAAHQIGIAPELCMAFEDANLGVQSAKAAGMLVLDVRSFTM